MDELSPLNRSYINQLKRLPCEPSQSSRSQCQSNTLSQRQAQDAIKQFKREIEERFKISVANKLYAFPRRYEAMADFISSDEDQEETRCQQTRVNVEEKMFKKKLNYDEAKKGSSKEPGQTNSSAKNGKNLSKKKGERKETNKESNRSKRLRTEPDSVNYVETIRLKMKKN